MSKRGQTKPDTEPARWWSRERLAQAAQDSARTVALVWNTDRVLASAVVVLGLIGGAMPAAIAWVGSWIVEAILRAVEDPQHRGEVITAIAVELGLVLASAAVQRLQELASSLLRALVAQRLNEDILEKAISLELAEFEDSAFYDRLTQARREASSRPLDHALGLADLVENALALAGLGALLVSLSPLAVLVLVIAALPAFVVQTRFSKDAFRLFWWRSPETRKQNYLEMVLARADHAKEVKLFGLGPLFLERYRAIFWSLWKADRDLTVRRAVSGFLLGGLATIAFYSVYAWIGWRAASGEISLGDMTMYLFVFRQGQATISRVLQRLSRFYDDHLYLRTLFEFLEHRSPLPGGGSATSGIDPSDGIRLEDVWFTYPGNKEPALRGVTLHLPPRRKLALVGENGAGKTTLIKLITGLYQPERGRILVDARPLPEWDPDALRRRIGVIFQDFVQYQLQVGENIGVGDVRAFDDEARWREAAGKGSAAELIEALPNGYRAQLGKWFDDGRELSQGQWQKVALSRAFMRRDADLLVLDEPTASMDAESEARIFARFRALIEDKSAILISHRFSTVRMADQIAVIEGGRLIELGSHQELMERGGRYAHLFTLQAQGYR